MFHYHNGVLQAEGVPLAALAARYGTPLYVYSHAALIGAYDRLRAALDTLDLPYLICYALKANANPALGRVLAERGAGADVVSGGELWMARRMGFPAARIVFAGVGKTRTEMGEALADPGIRAFHIESRGELEALAGVAAGLGKRAPVAVRVNPDVEAGTHPYITTGTATSKFGVSPAEALSLVRMAATHPHLEPVGIHAHIGSQLATVAPILESTRRLLELWDILAGEGISLRSLDIGGGLGIAYRPGETPEGPEELVRGLRPLLAGRRLELELEPGRYLMGPSGLLLTQVLYHKPSDPAGERSRPLVIVDAGMNDLIRPALYGAYHPIWPVADPSTGATLATDVAGPVCESSDFFATARDLPHLQPGDLVALGQAGAYGFTMASQYNGRPRPAEILVDGDQVQAIRHRESYTNLWPEEA